MSIRRAQGWALIASAVIALLSIIGSDSSFFRILFILGAVLLILGVPAIQLVQRSGMLGWAGILLIELGAIIALAMNLTATGGSAVVGPAVPLISALAGALGRVIVGWLTTRTRVFPSWTGWAFIAEGVLNFLGGVMAPSLFTSAVGLIVPLVAAAALAGYGWGIVQQASSKAHAAMA